MNSQLGGVIRFELIHDSSTGMPYGIRVKNGSKTQELDFYTPGKIQDTINAGTISKVGG